MAIQPSQLRSDNQEFKDEIEHRVDAAFEKDGYANTDRDGLPERSNSKLRVGIAAALGQAQVASKAGRYEGAARYVTMVGSLFPNVPGPGQYENYEDEDERLFAAAVWDKIMKLVDAQLRTVSLETLVDEMFGKTICKVVLHPDDQPTQFVYITEDIGCILQDYSGPRQAQIRRAQEAMAKALRPVIRRHPQHGKRLISEFKKSNTKLLETTINQLQLALPMSNGNGDGNDDSDDE